MRHFFADPLRILISSRHLSFHPSLAPRIGFLLVISETSLISYSTDYSSFRLSGGSNDFILLVQPTILFSIGQLLATQALPGLRLLTSCLPIMIQHWQKFNSPH